MTPATLRLGLLSLVVVPALALAQGKTPPRGGDLRDPAKVVRVDVEDAPLRDVCRQIARTARRTITVEPGFEAVVDALTLSDVPWPVALEAAASLCGGVVEFSPDGQRAWVWSARAVSLSRVRAQPAGLLLEVAKITGQNLIVGPRRSQGELSLVAYDLPGRGLMSLLAQAGGLQAVATPAGTVVGAADASTLPRGQAASGPAVEIRALNAPLAPLLRALVKCTWRHLAVSGAESLVSLNLNNVPWEAALEVTVAAFGGTISSEAIQVPKTPTSPLRPATPAVSRPRPADGRGLELRTLATALLGDIVTLARKRDHEALVVRVADLRQLCLDHGQPAVQALRAQLKLEEVRLHAVGEVYLSLELQLGINSANWWLEEAERRLQLRDVDGARAALTGLNADLVHMRGFEREVFHLNADALEAAGAKLWDELALVEQTASLVVQATISSTRDDPESQRRGLALIDGRLVRPGQKLSQAPRLQGVSVSAIEPEAVVVTRGGSSLRLSLD